MVPGQCSQSSGHARYGYRWKASKHPTYDIKRFFGSWNLQIASQIGVFYLIFFCHEHHNLLCATICSSFYHLCHVILNIWDLWYHLTCVPKETIRIIHRIPILMAACEEALYIKCLTTSVICLFDLCRHELLKFISWWIDVSNCRWRFILCGNYFFFFSAMLVAMYILHIFWQNVQLHLQSILFYFSHYHGWYSRAIIFIGFIGKHWNPRMLHDWKEDHHGYFYWNNTFAVVQNIRSI